MNQTEQQLIPVITGINRRRQLDDKGEYNQCFHGTFMIYLISILLKMSGSGTPPSAPRGAPSAVAHHILRCHPCTSSSPSFKGASFLPIKLWDCCFVSCLDSCLDSTTRWISSLLDYFLALDYFHSGIISCFGLFSPFL